MSDKSKIEWTDATWNPITGCTPASEGCLNCYAKAMAERFPVTHGGGSFSNITFHPDRLDRPLHWRNPRKVFVCSMGDLFHDDVKDEWIDQVFRIMGQCQKHTFMLLTKRPERMRRYIMSLTIGEKSTVDRVMNMWGYLYFHRHFVNYRLGKPMSNVWLGVSVENNAHRHRIIDLLRTPAAIRFVSVEPMLDDVKILCKHLAGKTDEELPDLDWVICGAETGAHKRPCKPEWIDSLRQQCATAGVPFFGKKDSKGQPIMPREWPEVTS